MKRTLTVFLLLLLPGIALAQTADSYFQPVDYRGAFGGGNWLEGWTALAEKGYLPTTGSGTTVVDVTDASIEAGQDVVWTADNIYRLNGVVFVEDGASLTIEPGTTVWGRPGQGNDASALVVARGGKLYAEGTALNPITFTADGDDGTLTYQDRGLWGGVVLLGRATTNNQPDGTKQVEGINEIAGDGDDRATYGGTDDNDSSGFAPQDFVQTMLAANGNEVADPMLRGVNRDEPAGGLDPRPAIGSVAPGGAASITTSVQFVDTEVPAGFTLNQNYPNPFNPVTTISFTLDRTQSVDLTVFDMLGRRVATLMAGVQSPGAYQVQYDGASMTSGLYVYRLQTEIGSVARTMMLVK